MTFEDFLKQCERYNAIRLIGPLFSPGLATFSTELPTLYIDGGLKFKLETPHLHFSLGDGDSSPLLPDLLLNPEKDFSDLAFALNQLPPMITQIHLDGFLGGRKDHEWINLGIVHNFLTERKVTAQVSFDQGEVRALGRGSWSFNFTGTFSVLCFDDADVLLEGQIKYPCVPAKNFPRFSSLGLSNEAFGKFKLETNQPLYLIQNS